MSESIIRDILVQAPFVAILCVAGYFIIKNFMAQLRDRDRVIAEKDKTIKEQYIQLGDFSNKTLVMFKDLSFVLDKVQENAKIQSKDLTALIKTLNRSINEQKPLLQKIIDKVSAKE